MNTAKASGATGQRAYWAWFCMASVVPPRGSEESRLCWGWRENVGVHRYYLRSVWSPVCKGSACSPTSSAISRNRSGAAPTSSFSSCMSQFLGCFRCRHITPTVRLPDRGDDRVARRARSGRTSSAFCREIAGRGQPAALLDSRYAAASHSGTAPCRRVSGQVWSKGSCRLDPPPAGRP
jgi:hypothetical protein